MDLRDTGTPAQASYRGDVQIYPASVVKMVFAGYLGDWVPGVPKK